MTAMSLALFSTPPLHLRYLLQGYTNYTNTTVVVVT